MRRPTTKNEVDTRTVYVFSAKSGKTPTDSSLASLCFIINYDFRYIGGAMTRFSAEVNYFASKGYPVTLIYSSSKREKPFKMKSVSYYNIRHIRHELVIFAVRLFFKCLNQRLSNKQTVFVANNPLSSIPPSLLRFLGLKSRTVLIMHGPSSVETYFKGKKVKSYFQLVVDRIAFTIVKKIIAVSEYERDYAVRLKTNPRKIAIIRNGIEFPKLIPNSPFRQELGIPSNWVVIGYLGSWVAYRGTEHLIEAFSIAKSKTKMPMALVLVIKEKLTEEQERRIRDIAGSHSNAVYIVKARKDVAPILSASDIYASHFSKKVDGIGFSIMEAMASALPVITGKDSITNKLLHDGENAILVDKENAMQIAEAIEKLTEDPLLRKKIGINAQRTAIEQFSRSHMLALCEKEYLNVVSH